MLVQNQNSTVAVGRFSIRACSGMTFSSEPCEAGKTEAEVRTEAPKEEADQESSPARPTMHIRSITDKMMSRVSKTSPTVQNGIDDLLRKLFEKYGGEAAGANMFFSEGDEDNKEDGDDLSPTLREADNRIKKKNSRRNVKHGTHSGVLSPAVAKTLNATASSEEDQED